MKILRYIILNLSLIVIISCDNQLEITPQDVLDADIALTSLDDLEATLIGAYTVLRRDGLYSESMFYLPDLMADNLRLGDSNGGQSDVQANWQYSASDDIDVWEDAYTLIFRANTVINNAGDFEDSPQKNRIVGQALALRALAHFDLLRFYAPDYNRNSERPGVPAVLAFEINKPFRNSVKEVYDQIFLDLTTARTMLGNVDKAIQVDGPHFFDQRAVTALLARVSLYAEEWQDAVNFATEVISVSSLSDPAEYELMWSEDADAEVLLSVAFTTPDEGRIGNPLYDIVTRKSLFTLTQDFTDIYDQVNDIRYSAFVLENTDPNPGDDLFFPFKYAGRGGERGLANAKILRVSEIYLIRAEANLNLNNDTEALADLNALRAKRITGYTDVDLSGAALATAIQLERRKELAIEGHRWFDLRRTGGDVVRGADCRGLTVNCTLTAGDHRFAYPIPLDEILANSNMTQNDGYTN